MLGLGCTIAGCSSASSFPEADIIAGPGRKLVFEPADLTISVGETVTWGFPSSGHNVCCHPGDNDEVEVPKDGQPFASYGPEESPRGSFVPVGGTYEHTFDVPGEYHYVCIPHVDNGMTGTVRVE